MEAGTGVMWPQIQEFWGSSQELEEVSNGFSPRVPRRNVALLGFLPSRTPRE